MPEAIIDLAIEKKIWSDGLGWIVKHGWLHRTADGSWWPAGVDRHLVFSFPATCFTPKRRADRANRQDP